MIGAQFRLPIARGLLFFKPLLLVPGGWPLIKRCLLPAIAGNHFGARENFSRFLRHFINAKRERETFSHPKLRLVG